MSNRKAAKSAATRMRECRPALGGSALALLVMIWTGASADLRADTIVLKSGEVLEGSIIDATRNTVIVQRTIGGMRQMPIRDIEEVRIEIAQGQRISGQLLSWADGVYQVRWGGQVVRISEGDILSREAGEEATGQPQRSLPPRPVGPQTVRMATAPATSAPEETAAARAAPAGAEMAAQRPEGEEQSLAAGEDQGPASDEEPSPAMREEQSLAAVDENQSPGAGEDQSGATGEEQSPAAGEEQSLAAVGEDQSPPAGEEQSLAVKASVDPAEPGAGAMVFRIELSRPAERTVVLIYGTVEGTAKAGEDFEPQQGVVTLAPGIKSAEVHVPLIEQASSTGEKRFELFLTADPKVAEVVDRRIIATIDGGN
jgi:hypothetical protein